jgi:hypothetical protein
MMIGSSAPVADNASPSNCRYITPCILTFLLCAVEVDLALQERQSTNEAYMAIQHQSPSVLVLFRGWEDHGCYVWSPFVTKVEFRLRLSNVPYIVKAGSPLTAPAGKIPYVNLGTDEAPAVEL